jgi:ribose 5-phosphate isomerase RpiB
VPSIRAALTHDTHSSERAALSNNPQIITMGARVVAPKLAKSVADARLAEILRSARPFSQQLLRH